MKVIIDQPSVDHPAATRTEAGLLVAIDAINTVEGRQRLATQEQFKELRENIQRHGLIHPIVVRPVKEGRFELVAGHHRLQALKELGFATVPVNVSEIGNLGPFPGRV